MSKYVEESTSEPSNFEYVTARVRARKAKLFDEDDYRKLVRMEPNEIARYMEESEYEDEVNNLASRHTGVDLIEYSLYENMARHFSDIERWSTGNLGRLVSDYLRKYDAWNIKTVLRGINVGATEEEIMSDIIPTGELGQEFVERLTTMDEIEQVVEALSGTVFEERLQEAYSEYEETGLLIPLENAADLTFYERLTKGTDESIHEISARGVYIEFLQAEVDILNVRNALRAAGDDNIEIDDYFIHGGKAFTEERLASLAENREELINALRESRYGDRVEEAINELEETGSLSEFDTALDEFLISYSERMTNQNPLSIAPVISYILSKEREIGNIRAIARAKEAGLSTEEIENELVI